MSEAVNNYILNKVLQRKEANNFRELKLNSGLVDFFSNDYLGFARNELLHQKVMEEIQEITSINKSGSTGSRLLSGNTSYAVALEKQLADFHQAESAIIFNSGYDANLGVLSALPYKNATVLYDALVHASMHDGMKLSRADKIAFNHNDVTDLEAKLQQVNGLKFIAIEALYSMDGDEAPLKEIVSLAKKYDAAIILDEAHSTGIFGQYGEGKAQSELLHQDIFVRIHTFGKAIGAHGAVVLCSKHVKDFLINYSRPFIFSTAIPKHALAAIKIAYDYLPTAQTERNQLRKNILQFTTEMAQTKNFELFPSDSPIQCLVKEGNTAIKALAEKIQLAGLDVRAILQPTVPIGKERIRVCLHSFNTSDEISRLTKIINELI